MKQRTLRQRIRELPWDSVGAELSEEGVANAGPLLRAAECAALVRCFREDPRFRSRVSMERHNFGRGDYAYFADPLPGVVTTLREELYRRLAPVANDWSAALGETAAYPKTLDAFQSQCRSEGQTKPTPLLLRYRAGGCNRLHRDLYGPLQFPLQGMVMLSRPGADFDGGEFLVVENRARQQSLGRALTPARGELVLFAGGERPVAGKRGMLRASHRHGMSRVTRGERFALGVIFHDAR